MKIRIESACTFGSFIWIDKLAKKKNSVGNLFVNHKDERAIGDECQWRLMSDDSIAIQLMLQISSIHVQILKRMLITIMKFI